MHSVLCVAGLDPSGHAGLSADFRALNFLGVHCFPVISALTVQNENFLRESQPVSPELIKKQLDAIFHGKQPDAVKLGVLGDSQIAELVAGYFSSKSIPVITDPVFTSSTGYRFVNDDMIESYRRKIIPLSSIVTPNAQEASEISGLEVNNPEDARIACQRIFELGPCSVLLKGGHFKESVGTDVFYDSSGFHVIEGEEIEVSLRGTGCAYSALIAGYIAIGMDVFHAVKKAKDDMITVLSASARVGNSLLNFGYINRNGEEGQARRRPGGTE